MKKNILLCLLIITFATMIFSTSAFATQDTPETTTSGESDTNTVDESPTDLVAEPAEDESVEAPVEPVAESESSTESAESETVEEIQESAKETNSEETTETTTTKTETVEDDEVTEDLELTKDEEKIVDSIISAAANKYDVTTEDINDLISVICDSFEYESKDFNIKTDVWLTDDNSLIITGTLEIIFTKTGDMYINDILLPADLTGNYELTLDEVYTFIAELEKETSTEGSVTMEEDKDGNIIITSEEVISEISSDGVITIFGEELTKEDLEIFQDEEYEPDVPAIEKINPIKEVFVEKGALPQTGENNSTIYIILGILIVAIGLGAFIFMKKKALVK